MCLWIIWNAPWRWHRCFWRAVNAKWAQWVGINKVLNPQPLTLCHFVQLHPDNSNNIKDRHTDLEQHRSNLSDKMFEFHDANIDKEKCYTTIGKLPPFTNPDEPPKKKPPFSAITAHPYIHSVCSDLLCEVWLESSRRKIYWCAVHRVCWHAGFPN